MKEDISFETHGGDEVDADVVVIGAGAAGLAAARRCAERSLRVILLEARDRVGGRVQSEIVTRTATPAELGAEFIHGQARETMALLDEIGAAAIDTAEQSWSVGPSGALERDEDDFFSDAKIFEPARSLPKDESVAEFLGRFASDRLQLEAVLGARAFVEGFEAANPEIASVRAIAEEIGSGVDFTSARPLGGYRIVFERLHMACAALGVDIRLSHVVRRVSWRVGSVRIETHASGGESRSISARSAIVTLPVGVLRHGDVAFDPGLPSEKAAALSNLEMGHVFKVVLWFKNAFWERLHDGAYRDAGFFRPKADVFAVYWTQYPVRSELVSAWAGGPKADVLLGVSHDQLITSALHGFGTLLGSATVAEEAFEGGIVHDWGADPFARGAYSYVTVGGEHARAQLAAPVDGTLFFAGEATSTDGQGGTVNGALNTGERAAAEAVEAMR